MITPRFSLTQDSNYVTITIRAPYCSLKDLDVSVEENNFIFHCHPYYLRLNLPGQIEENDRSKTSFDADTGNFTLKYEKVNPDEHFPDLEFITKLLCEKLEVDEGGRKIEILASEGNAVQDGGQSSSVKYGFAMRGGYEFNCVISEFSEVFETDPKDVDLDQRRKLRLADEQKQFDREYYLAETFEKDEEENEYYEYLKTPSPWSTVEPDTIQFTPEELDFLKDISNIKYSLSDEQKQYCRCNLIEILYAYCYDQRTNNFETSVESGWTISKLSASLCWFDGFTTPKEALISGFRRSLIYPLYRDFELCYLVFKDLKALIALGAKYLIKTLIQIHNIFNKGDSRRYILNNVFIKDYIIYIMKWDKEAWQKAVEEVKETSIRKDDLGLNLVQIEREYLQEDDVLDKMNKLTLEEEDSDDSSDSSDETNSDSSDETDSDSSETDSTLEENVS